MLVVISHIYQSWLNWEEGVRVVPAHEFLPLIQYLRVSSVGGLGAQIHILHPLLGIFNQTLTRHRRLNNDDLLICDLGLKA